MKRRIAFILLISVFLTGGCADSGTVSQPNYSAENEVGLIGTISVSNTEEAIDAVLTYATADFIGSHPIDENFLIWIADNYGVQALTEVVTHTDFNDPEIWYMCTGKSIHVLYYEYCRMTGVADASPGDVRVIECANDNEIVLDFCGDLSMAADVATTLYMEEQPEGLSDCFSDDLLREMRGADIFVANNEFVFSERGEPTPEKAYTFRANPAYAGYLNDIGVDLATLANNHVYDYGEIGLLDTLDTLSAAEVPYIGAGRDLSEAMLPIYYIANGRKIAIVNATQIERSFPYTKEATEDSPGVLKTLHSERFCSVIEQAHKNADYCIAVVHWGTEGNAYYGQDQIALAQDFVEAGADAIIGGHTHCLEGIEFIGDVPVYYSLGNYWFSLSGAMPADYDTGLASIRIKNDGTINYEFIPCRFTNGVTRTLTEAAEARELFDYLSGISQTTIIEDDGTIRQR